MHLLLINRIISSVLDKELEGLVDEGSDAEQWLENLSMASEDFMDDLDDELTEVKEPENSNETIQPTTNLDWLDEMKKEAAMASAESSEDALNLLGGLGILDSVNMEDLEESENNFIPKDLPNQSDNETLAEGLSWLDSLSGDDGVSDDDLSSLVSEEDEDESEIKEVALDDEQPIDIESEKSSDEALAEGLSWLDSLSGDDGVSDDDLSSLVSEKTKMKLRSKKLL